MPMVVEPDEREDYGEDRYWERIDAMRDKGY